MVEQLSFEGGSCPVTGQFDEPTCTEPANASGPPTNGCSNVGEVSCVLKVIALHSRVSSEMKPPLVLPENPTTPNVGVLVTNRYGKVACIIRCATLADSPLLSESGACSVYRDAREV